MTGKNWYAAEVHESLAAREAVEYGLMQAGALGTETRELDNHCVSVIGYLEERPGREDLRAHLLAAYHVYGLTPSPSLDFEIHEIPDRDWLAEWKKSWQPVAVGRFIVAPPWIEPVTGGPAPESGDSPIIIRIEPGMAFGTGTHETTRLCLHAIAKHFRGGSFLDVGTGTGILAIAAARMFPEARIQACDTDISAIGIAKENAHLNDVADRIEFRAGSIDAQTASADTVCANLTAPVIVELLPLLLGAACGRLLLSGILDTQVELVESRVRELGARVFEIDRDGEWVALVV